MRQLSVMFGDVRQCSLVENIGFIVAGFAVADIAVDADV